MTHKKSFQPTPGSSLRSSRAAVDFRDGKVVEREYWSVDQGVPMPDVFWMYDGAYEWQSHKKHILDVASAPDN